MVLIIEGQRLEKQPASVSSLETLFPPLAARSERFRSSELRRQSIKNLLYVHQREFAVVSPSDERIDVIGSDDATTCHLLVLRSTSSGVTALSHLDGCGVEKAVADMVSKINELSFGAPEGGRLEAHVIGGFIDDRDESRRLFDELTSVFRQFPAEIHLVTLCSCEANDVVKSDGLHYPRFLGIGVDCKTGVVFPAFFPEEDRGPDRALRSARHFTGSTQRRVDDVYDAVNRQLKIRPFFLTPWSDAPLWLAQPDKTIRRCLSTSPEQEPQHFVAHIRETLRFIVENEPSLVEYFGPCSNSPRRYVLTDDGRWERIAAAGDENDEVSTSTLPTSGGKVPDYDEREIVAATKT